MTSDNLQLWIQHPESLNRDTLYELRALVTRYPYFQSVRLLYLKNLFLLHDITFGSELRKATLHVTDRRSLFYLIEGDKYALQASRKQKTACTKETDEEPTLDRTLSLIDAFLSTVPEEVTQQTSLDYTTDYTSYLLQEEDVDVSGEVSEVPQLRGQSLIDDFIEMSGSEPTSFRLKPMMPIEYPEESADEVADEVVASANGIQSEEDDDDSCFTETLAKIYVKQHRYSKALEIIKKLSLKYPKKNAYFADQIRFLEKLIINAKSK